MKQGKQRLKLFVDKIEKIGDFKKFKKSEDKKVKVIGLQEIC